MRNIALLGSTGSIGTATLDVVRSLGADWRVWGISGHGNLDRLAEAAQSLSPVPEVIVASDAELAHSFDSSRWPTGCQVITGADALNDLASRPQIDILVAAIVGRAGLESTLAAIDAGKRIALANKETLVIAGPIVHRAVQRSGAQILPVDSEHSAIFQCIESSREVGRCAPRRLILTASGGPFRDWTVAQMRDASVEQTLSHPIWNMGRKISVDSATMMNKALEIIEARWLFDVPASSIDVVVHPQSIIHSMVEFPDSSVIAQLSPPDMRLPIQYALTYPDRLPCPCPEIDIRSQLDLSLGPVDLERFPAIELGFEAARAGGTTGAVINAANEEAVGLFLNGKIRFTDIVPACQLVLDHHSYEEHPCLDRLLEIDLWARAEVQRWHSGAKY